MRQLREMLRRTRSSFLRISGGINGRLNALENRLQSQSARLLDLEKEESKSTHCMEIEEENRREIEFTRHGSLTDKQLRKDLSNQYGPTKWAAKLINEIMAKRAPTRAVTPLDTD